MCACIGVRLCVCVCGKAVHNMTVLLCHCVKLWLTCVLQLFTFKCYWVMCPYAHRKTDEGCICIHPSFVGMYTDTSLIFIKSLLIMHITNSIKLFPPKFPAEYQTLSGFLWCKRNKALWRTIETDSIMK